MSNKIYLNKENIKTLKPVAFWQAFYELNQVPRGSGNPKTISKYLEEYFKKYCNEVRVDQALNVTAIVPATKGCEDYPTIIIQAHMDMVCEKVEGSTHDFSKDPISMYMEDGWIHADGTTLGADDGAGIALMMVLASDKTIPHGPLELVATTDEETTVNGALAYHDTKLKGEYVINVDSENDWEIFIGSAGTNQYDMIFDLKREEIKNVKYLTIDISGAIGGHSAMQINKKQINVLAMLNELVVEVSDRGVKTWLVDFNGGAAKNSIPSFGKIVIAVENNQVQKAKDIINEVYNMYCEEYMGYEHLKFTISESDTYKYLPINETISKNIWNAFILTINGITVYDYNQSQLDASNSTGEIICDQNQLRICRMTRYNFNNQSRSLMLKDKIIAQTYNAKIEREMDFAPWSPKFKTNKMINVAKSAYEKIRGNAPKVVSTPGGLELAAILDHHPQIKDAISIGQNMKDIHSVNECLEISSSEFVYEWLIEILKNANKFEK